MTKISKELIEWAIHKIENEYKEDVSLLIGHSHWNIKPDGDDVAFNFFIPATKAGYKLAQTFIIDGIGYDLFPMSWERVEGLASINESLTTCLADGVILYAKSDADRERFIHLQKKLQDNLADPSFTYKKGLEKINTAMELYKTMLFENSLGSGRKASGFIADYLSQAVATVNGVYFKRGPENQISHLAEMYQVPEHFSTLFESLIAAKSLETIKTLCYQMIETTRAFFEGIMPEKKQSPQEYNYEDLACWYEEGVYTFRRIYYYAAQKDVFNAFAWGYHFQREFDAIEEEFGLEPMDLMGVFDPENLDAFAARAKAIDASIRGEIEKRGVTLREYDSLDAFLAAQRS